MPDTTRQAELEQQPGHLIRRLQQIAVALFMEEAKGLDLTPVQFAALTAAQHRPGMDQRRLAQAISFDTSTTGGVIDRLEVRGLLRRRPSAEDRRVRRIHLTSEGEAVLSQAVPAMLLAQQRILAPLPPEDRARFMVLLRGLVVGHESEAMHGQSVTSPPLAPTPVSGRGAGQA